jgi:predicted GIY-YIG superfamily endonuclease
MAGGWVYVVTNRPNRTLCAGVTSDARRGWKIRSVLEANPDWRDLYEDPNK